MNCVLITGGTGFIGSHLVEKILSIYDSEIIVVDNNFACDVLPEVLRSKIVFEKVDIRDFELMERIFEEKTPKICFHLAAIHFIPYCQKHPKDVIDINVKGTSNIHYLCKKYSCNLIQASSAAIYSPDDEPHKEQLKTDPMDIYGYSKKVNEETLKFFFDDLNNDIYGVNARFFNVYGTRDTHPHVITEIIDQIKKQMTSEKIHLELGNIEPKRDFIHVDDLVNGMIAISNKITSGIHTYNLGSGESWSIREIISKIENILKKEIVVNISEKRFRKSDRMNLQADIQTIKEEIGWEPKISIDEGLELLLKADLKL